MESHEKRAGILYAITSPLGFFALSLLIVEGFLTIALVFSDLAASSKFFGMLIGAVLFLVVVIGVLLLVCYKPENLTFSENSHLKWLEMKTLGSSNKPGEETDARFGNLASPVSGTSPDSAPDSEN